MSSAHWKTWRVPLIALGVLITILAWLTFGERGLVRLYQTELERQAHIERIRELVEENQVLLEEIERLRTDMSYIESVARRELNLIRENEVVYRFQDPGFHDPAREPNPWKPPDEKPATSTRRGVEHGESR
jgi:cell division protein FtsB